MLSQIYIKKFLYITDININLSKNLNIFTGETGVGKSLIVDAISFVLGEKGKYHEGDFVEIVFDDVDSDFSEEGTLILAREIKNGKSVYFINGKRATLSTLKEASKNLIEIHGQHHQQNLFNQDFHRAVIDSFSSLEPLLKEYQEVYKKFILLQREEEILKEEQSNRLRELDILKFQLEELEELGLQEDEKEQLEQEYNYLSNITTIKEIVNSSIGTLHVSDNSVHDQIGEVIRNLEKISDLKPEITQLLNDLEEAKAIVENVSYSLRNFDTDVDFHRLVEIEERLNQINRLEKKYNRNANELIELIDEFSERIQYLENLEYKLPEVQKEKEETYQKVLQLADQISKIRKEKAKEFDKQVQYHLSHLALENSVFKTEVKEKSLDKYGKDKISFLFSGNKGFQPDLLEKTASGGELSRISLAIKLVSKNSVDSMIFDEIDTGIGGKVAVHMAKKLKELSKDFQVILITHLPQVAVLADKHFYVEKIHQEDKTVAKIKEIKDNEREKEIARMLSGIVNSESIQFARKLIQELSEENINV